MLPQGYELRFSDNGLGMPNNQAAGMLELFQRAAPPRAAGLGVGLAKGPASPLSCRVMTWLTTSIDHLPRQRVSRHASKQIPISVPISF